MNVDPQGKVGYVSGSRYAIVRILPAESKTMAEFQATSYLEGEETGMGLFSGIELGALIQKRGKGPDISASMRMRRNVLASAICCLTHWNRGRL